MYNVYMNWDDFQKKILQRTREIYTSKQSAFLSHRDIVAALHNNFIGNAQKYQVDILKTTKMVSEITLLCERLRLGL